jgi:hypothetical protein
MMPETFPALDRWNIFSNVAGRYAVLATGFLATAAQFPAKPA